MPRLHLNGFIFTPKLAPSIAMLIILPILIGLGCWQLQRAAFKTQLQHDFASKTQIAITDLTQPQQHPQQFSYRSVQLTGHYDNAHSILLDNRIVNHRAGYYVLTPFIMQNNPRILLVNRGWIPRLRDRRQLPQIDTITGQQTINGMIKLPGKRRIQLQSPRITTQWPLLLQTFNLKVITEQLKQPLFHFTILLSAKQPHGFVRQWQATSMPAKKHVGYAIQWFALALTLVIIYAVVNTHRERHDSAREDQD